MVSKKFLQAVVWGAAGLSQVPALAQGPTDQPQDKKELKVTSVVISQEDGKAPVVQDATIVVGKLWLGIALKSVEGDLSDFLGSAKGVLVDDVYKDSPAFKSGLKKGDVVQSVDGKELSGPSDLMALLKEAKVDQPLTLKIRRNNQELELQVTPEARPKEMDLNIDIGQGIFQPGQMKLDLTNPQNMKLFRMGVPSGVITRGGSALKGDIKVHITTKQDGKTSEIHVHREGDHPATIKVTEEGETKEYTQDQMDQLPEHLQGIVQSILNSNSGAAVFSWFGSNGEGELFVPDIDALKEQAEALRSGAQSFNFRFNTDGLQGEDLKKHMDEVRKQVMEATERAREEARELVQKSGRTVIPPRTSDDSKSNTDRAEIQELRAMVEALKKEISELKAAGKDSK